jgi:hypothetical protein
MREMQLTPDQQEQIRQAKSRGERQAFVQLSPQQKKHWREMVDQEMAGKHENIAHFQKVRAAAEQPGFFGDVRRAILLSRRPVSQLAAEIQVDARTLSDFCSGDLELPASALDRLIGALGLRLMQEIPR